PPLLAGHLDEGQHIRAQSLGGKGLFQLAHDGGHAALAVAALHDLAAALIELHHAFRIEQHVALLRRLPLQAKARADPRAAAAVRRRHGFTPYFRAIASFMAQRMSSLNCSTSSARSCRGRVVKWPSVISS